MADRFSECFLSKVPGLRPNKPISFAVPEALLCRHVLLLQCIDLLFLSGIVPDHSLVEPV